MSQQKPKISTSFSYETLEETLDIKPRNEGMMIGMPKEIAFQENRIALTPDAVSVLVSNGHQVVIEPVPVSCTTGPMYTKHRSW
jgi:alanine dehydrogenase